MWWLLTLEAGLIIWLSVNQLGRLASKTVQLHVRVSVLASYMLSLSIVALVPLDVHLVYVRRCLHGAQQFSSATLQEHISFECSMKWWGTWRLLYPELSDAQTLELSENVLRQLWKWVFVGSAFNGWFLLTSQMHFVEALHFRTWQRLQVACIKQANFWMSVIVLLCMLLVLLVSLDEDWKFVFYGLMAVGNTVMLLVVILLLGYGLAEFPISLWQEGRAAASLQRHRCEALRQHATFKHVAGELATKLALVHDLRILAAASLRHFGRQIMRITRECPVDVAGVLLMHPIRGPSIPITMVEKEAALLAALSQAERERLHGSSMTEVDAWIESLEATQMLPAAVDVCALQDRLYAARLRSMGDVDYLDPILADAHALQSERFASIIKALLSLLPPPPAPTPSDPSRIVLDRPAGHSIPALAASATPQQPMVCDTLLVSPGSSEVAAARDVLRDTGVSFVSPTTMATGGSDLEAETRRALARAVMRRNDASLRVHRGIVGDDAWEGGGEVVGGLRCAESVTRDWTENRLVLLRTELFHLTRQYRKAKRKFDLAVMQAILLEDVETAYKKLLAGGSMLSTLYAAFTAPEGVTGGRGEDNLWQGVESPVRIPFTGRYGLKFEVLWLVWHAMLKRPVKMAAAVLSVALAVSFLWSEMSVAPWVRGFFSGPQQGSLLLSQVCWSSTLPPCQVPLEVSATNFTRVSEGVEGIVGKYYVSATVQVILVCHLLFFLRICDFSLQRLRLWKLYEVVSGETDAKSLLVNAFLMCRLVPAITQNYLNMLREAHEARTRDVEATVFEETFSIMGKIPFVGSSFNEVLPPLLLIFFLFNFALVLGRMFGLWSGPQTLELFALLEGIKSEDSLSRKEQDLSIQIIAAERRRYERLQQIVRHGGRRASVLAASKHNLADVKHTMAGVAELLRGKTQQGTQEVLQKLRPVLLSGHGGNSDGDIRHRLQANEDEVVEERDHIFFRESDGLDVHSGSAETRSSQIEHTTAKRRNLVEEEAAFL